MYIYLLNKIKSFFYFLVHVGEQKIHLNLKLNLILLFVYSIKYLFLFYSKKIKSLTVRVNKSYWKELLKKSILTLTK